MPLHGRKQLRDLLKTRLTGLSTATGGVHVGKRSAWTGAQLPGIGLYLDSETVERPDKRGPRLREIVVLVDLAAADANGEALDDLLDAMALEVEVALAADPRLGGRLIAPLELDSTQPTPPEAQIGQSGAIRRLVYRAAWQADPRTPHTIVA